MSGHPINDLSLRESGRNALARGEWEAAVERLEAAVAGDPSDPQGWELLGTAHAWIQASDRAIAARQQAYEMYRERGEDAGAARVSLELANDYFEAKGELAVANGWFQRSRRLLQGLPPSRDHALLRIWDAYMALMGESQPDDAVAHAREAVAIAEATGADDILCLGLALQGLSHVSAGRVPEGMPLLDEAIAGAIGGEFTDPQWFYLTCCCMIDACDRARDYGRSMEWCRRLRDYCTRWRVQAFLTTCRLKFTGALLWRGEWERCEQELEAAAAELNENRPSSLPAALARLAELRRRQGRLAEAEELVVRASGHPEADMVRAALALDAGTAEPALDLVDAMLRQLPESARTERISALETKVRAHAQLGQRDAAAGAAKELATIAEVIGTPPLRAMALAAEARALGSSEPDETRRRLEDAIQLFDGCGSPYQAAQVRLDLAEHLAQFGRMETSREHGARALDILEPLGAAADAERARRLMNAPDAEAARRSARRSPAPRLTQRQTQVLGLVAEGLSDREIAERLHLSDHTVHRHIANIFTRLGVASRSAAVARALREELI